MIKEKIRILLLVLFVSITVYAQTNTILIPRNVQQAIDKGTRTLNGVPGKNFWQNRADYIINAELDPVTNELSGTETITYFNNSPDTLSQIVIKLLPDIYRKGNMRDFEIDQNVLHSGVAISDLFYNNEQMKRNSSKSLLHREGTNLFLTLTQGLKPGTSAELKISWNYVIPNESQIRTGAYDSTSFLIAYWYPQIAVYDDIDGWDVNNYTGYAETYNDFNNYDVRITVPKNFVVWSTGILTNTEEVLSPKILERFKQAYNSDNIVHIITEKDIADSSVTIDQKKLTYKLKAENVLDFVFGTSDHYLWDGSSLVVDKKNNRRTFIDAVYKQQSKDFYSVAQIAKEAIDYFSNQMPGVPYPYPEMTIFNGLGGMEFPMMVNDSSIENDLPSTYGLTSHEICHTYFPFYMGINERKYAWMDEGMAVALPMDFQKEHGQSRREDNIKQYNEYAGNELDVPPIIPAAQLRNPSYRTASYRRPGAAYDILRNMLGDELFKKCLHEYMNEWKGKHPIPYDFFYSFNKTAGEDLNWYWNSWFCLRDYPDLAITFNETNHSSNSFSVKIFNLGKIPVPVVVKALYEEGTEEILINRSAAVWKNGISEIIEKVDTVKKVVRLELGDKWIPDVNPKNNFIEAESK